MVKSSLAHTAMAERAALSQSVSYVLLAHLTNAVNKIELSDFNEQSFFYPRVQAVKTKLVDSLEEHKNILEDPMDEITTNDLSVLCSSLFAKAQGENYKQRKSEPEVNEMMEEIKLLYTEAQSFVSLWYSKQNLEGVCKYFDIEPKDSADEVYKTVLVLSNKFRTFKMRKKVELCTFFSFEKYNCFMDDFKKPFLKVKYFETVLLPILELCLKLNDLRNVLLENDQKS